MKIFDLNDGESFKLSDKIYKIIKFQKKRRPRIGVVLVCITTNEDNKESHFISNFEIEKV